MLLAIIAASTAVISTPGGFVREPSINELAAAFPESAARSHVNGTASIYCKVDMRGAMSNCSVRRESPEGYGFGAAALELAGDYQAKSGSDRPSYVVIPVNFDHRVRAERDRLESAGPIIQSVTWLQAPSFADVSAAYPARAGGVEGSSTIFCRFGAEGRLSRCQVTRESPGGLGFGEAAKSLAAKFVVNVDPSWSMGDDRFGVEIPIRLAAPETAGMRAHLIGEPVWTTTFSPTAAATFFPSEAAAKGMTTGRGIAECTVEASGALKSCRPGSAEPEGAGFSEAAAKAASSMRMSPWTRDGGPVDGAIVRVPIRLTFEEPSTQNTAENAVFLGTPTTDDMLRVFPRRALVRNVAGEVDLRCRVEAGGEVDHCTVARELPGGWGFGAAAESLASKYRVSMRGRDHPTIGAWITVPVTMETMSH